MTKNEWTNRDYFIIIHLINPEKLHKEDVSKPLLFKMKPWHPHATAEAAFKCKTVRKVAASWAFLSLLRCLLFHHIVLRTRLLQWPPQR